MLKPLLCNPLAICVVVAAIVSIAFLKIPLLLTMLILLAFYSAIIWRRVMGAVLLTLAIILLSCLLLHLVVGIRFCPKCNAK